MTPPARSRKRNPELFLNRELSWLEFNARVLEEARDTTNPLLERLKFATIAASNLDEFIMVRLAGLERRIDEGDTAADSAGFTPSQQLERISVQVHEMTGLLYRALLDEILPALAERGIAISSPESLDATARDDLRRLFGDQIFPALTPLAIDSSRPFPMLANLSLNLALLLAPAGGAGKELLGNEEQCRSNAKVEGDAQVAEAGSAAGGIAIERGGQAAALGPAGGERAIEGARPAGGAEPADGGAALEQSAAMGEGGTAGAGGQPPSEGAMRLAVVQVPARIPRLIRLDVDGAVRYVFLEEIIRAEIASLFPGQTVLGSAVFRITRDSELELDDEGGRDLIENIVEELKRRRRGQVVRLEVEAGAAEALLAQLATSLEVASEEVYRLTGPPDIRALATLLDLPALEDMRDPSLRPLPMAEQRSRESMFSLIEERDLLLHHPYDAFDPVVALVTQAADDPDVLAIKQTLYRTSGDSPVVRALARAAERGKQVTVLVELLARFDEESNIKWSHALEEAGAHVIYGVRGYKTHAKILLVVRRTAQGIRRYVHLATGNYNDRTARLYTDFGLMTADPAIGEDASAFFNALTGYSDPPRMKKLVMAPTRMRERLLDLIAREKRRAEAGQAAEIRAKMNALVDEDLIRALYEASTAGVRVRLNVRGICCLKPGLKGVSERIEVVSIVDRFLEHARIVHFNNGGDEQVYLSSADWMPRNLDRRIELLFPVEAPECRRKVLRALDAMFEDTVKARVLQSDGAYKRKRPVRGEEPLRAQIQLYREAEQERKRLLAAAGVVLEPISAPAEREPRT